MKKTILVAAAMTAALTALPAAAQFQKPEDAVKYRQAGWTMIAAHFGRVAAMAQGKAPFDAKVAAENIALVNTLHQLPLAGFDPVTEKSRSGAKPAVWRDAAGFKAAGEKYVAEIAKLDAAGKTGDFAQIKAAVGAVGQSCKGCHDKFRAD